jgi:transposase InsO family protein
MKDHHSIQMLCATFDVSASGYYGWRSRLADPSPRARQNQALAQTIKSIHAASRQTYGSPRIQIELRKTGARHGRNRIARLMRQEGLCGRQKARYRVRTTDSNHDEPIAPNRLAKAPKPTAPDQIWVADITCIDGPHGWLYVAAILDLFSRKIVGWAMGDRIDTALVLKALSMALLHRDPPANLIFHSDRGVQYAAADYRGALAQAGITPSMSRKGNCYDNAFMESFWSTLKIELVYRCAFQNHDEAKKAIFDYIETFYNRKRIHSALGFLSPVDFENQNN